MDDKLIKKLNDNFGKLKGFIISKTDELDKKISKVMDGVVIQHAGNGSGGSSSQDQLLDNVTYDDSTNSFTFTFADGSTTVVPFTDDIGAFAYDVQNGLTQTGNDIELGGTLIKDTEIDGDNHSLTLTDLSEFNVRHDFNGYAAIQIRNNDDAGNGAGAVLELKGSGADYTNNVYFGKYGNSFWIPELRGNGALITDKDLILGSVGGSTRIIHGNSYVSINEIAHTGNNGLYYESDFSAANVAEDRWLTDKEYVDIHGYPAPVINNVLYRVINGDTRDITITGSFFTPTTVFTIGGVTINTTTFVDDHNITVNITGGAVDGFYDITATSNTGSYTSVNNMEVYTPLWKDLRLGGDVFTDGNAAGNDIRYRDTMSMTRDANGMYFTGDNPWRSWVKFEVDGFLRSANPTVSWIFTRPDSAMMIGIGSDATDEANTSQYAQMETEVYFQNGNTMYGLYGNTGSIGSAGNQNVTTSISGGSGVFKAEFTNSGTAGTSTYTLYELPSANQSDWDDTSNVKVTFTVGGTLNPDEPNLFPVIIPRDGGAQRFIAYKVE